LGNFDFNTVFHQMTPEEVEEANIALDIASEQLKNATRKKMK